MITDRFLVAAGTVIGIEHRLRGRNNQDGFAVMADENNLAAIVCDGCSSSPGSEVGAKLIARLAADSILKLMARKQASAGSEILPLLREEILFRLRAITRELPEPGNAVDEMFLATIIGATVNDHTASVFSLGDGIFSVNGQSEVIDENNRPNYLAYSLSPGDYPEVDQQSIDFILRKEIPTSDFESLAIATDGAAEFEKKKNQTFTVLGKEETVRGFAQFEQEERYLKNPSLLAKRLFLLNAEKTTIDWSGRQVSRFPGIFNDDTTIVLIRRR
jgi:hypothetical protein